MLAGLKIALIVAGMFATGTINTIAKKVQFGVSAPGYYNHSADGAKTIHPYNKPWFQTYLMFIGELLCLVGYLVYKIIVKMKFKTPGGEFRREEWEASQFSKPVFDWVFILPTVCDITGSTLQGIGLMYIDASVWQMLRGSIIVFAGILSFIFLKRKLQCFQWTGMLVTVIGLALVGVASVFKPSHQSLHISPIKAALGVFFVLLGSFMTATQMVVEEVFLKKKDYHPLHCVGMEGLFGCLIMSLVVLPIIHNVPGVDLNGSFENQLDALYQSVQNPTLLATSILLICSIAFFNYFGLAVTGLLSAVHRSLLDALRSVFVWFTSVLLYYVAGHQYGEPIDSAWTLVEIDGFALLVMGTFIFNRTLRLDWMPCVPPYQTEVEYSRVVNEASVEATSTSTTAATTATTTDPTAEDEDLNKKPLLNCSSVEQTTVDDDTLGEASGSV